MFTSEEEFSLKSFDYENEKNLAVIRWKLNKYQQDYVQRQNSLNK